MTAMLEAQALRKVYRGGDGNPIEVLAGIDLSIDRGEFVAIVGASGSGKSTLLHLLGALDTPSGGSVRLAGQSYDDHSPESLAAVRNKKLGFVFQFHHLLREFAVGLAGRMSHRPSELSGGEQQRAAVARALVADPLVVLADEPSGNLDYANSERLHQLFAHLSRQFETALVVVTHNRSLAARADRVLSLDGGRLVPLSSVESMP
jgi:lipoprotein-releasing system ATP-binding protein